MSSPTSIWVRAGGTIAAYSFCKLSTGAVVESATSTGTDTLGVVQSACVSGDMVEVVIAGFTKIVTTEALVPGENVSATTAGAAIAMNASDAVLGQYLPQALAGAALANSETTGHANIYLFANKTNII